MKLMKPLFWLVWDKESSLPTREHPTEISARYEAERLARANPGNTFHVLRNIGSCKKMDVIWSSSGEDIPF